MPGETKEGNKTDTFKARDKNRTQHSKSKDSALPPTQYQLFIFRRYWLQFKVVWI